MTAISTREHEKLMEFLHTRAIINDGDALQQDVLLLRQIHDDYQLRLAALRQLVRDYDAVQRRVRTAFRKSNKISISGLVC